MALRNVSPDDHSHLAIRLMMIMLPYMPLVCIVAILGTMLQVYGRFGPMAAAPILLNACIVTAAVGGGQLGGAEIEGHVTIVAISVIVAGVLQVIWTVASLWRTGRSQSFRIEQTPSGDVREHFTRMLRQALPMFIGLGVLQLNAFFDNFIAGYPTAYGSTIAGYEFPLKPGSLTALSNAQRLYEFPLGVFGIAVATAIFPALARVAGDRDDERKQFAETVRRGLRLVMFIGLPASGGLVLVRHQLTTLVFYGEKFTAADVDRVAFVLLGYAPAVWAYSMIHTLTRAFYAKGDSITPVKIAVGMVALNLLLNLTLIWTPLREAGLAWSTAICATIQVVILLRASRRYVTGVVDASVRSSWLKTMAITMVMSATVWVVGELLPNRELRWSWAAIEALVLVGSGAAIIALGAAVLRMPEMSWAIGRSTQATR
jgi:putative peptidoglycan lipid II flippase